MLLLINVSAISTRSKLSQQYSSEMVHNQGLITKLTFLLQINKRSVVELKVYQSWSNSDFKEWNKEPKMTIRILGSACHA
jgi:hypothetical protein